VSKNSFEDEARAVSTVEIQQVARRCCPVTAGPEATAGNERVSEGTGKHAKVLGVDTGGNWRRLKACHRSGFMPRLAIRPVRSDNVPLLSVDPGTAAQQPLGASHQAAQRNRCLCNRTLSASQPSALELLHRRRTHGPISDIWSCAVFSPTGLAAIPVALFSREPPRVLGIRRDLDSYTNKKSNS
jgi:hypothetical protein